MSRVAFLLPNLRGGGAERVALTLAEDFLAAGDEVDLVLANAVGEFLPQVPEPVRIVDLQAKSMRGALRPLVRYLRQRKPDALQASMWPITIIALLARRLARANTRVVVSDHTILSRQYARGLSASLLKVTTRLFYPAADARICVSEASAHDLARLSHLPRQDFAVIGNPILLSASSDADECVAELWPVGCRRVLTIGSLKPVKNHALLLRALARLNQNMDVAAMIVGKGMLIEETKRLAEELGLGGKVVIPGFQRDVARLYESADVFVLSSNHEGFGNVLVEALLAGLPIVSTDCPGEPANILDVGRYGRLVPVDDEQALAQAIELALSEPVNREAQRQRGRELSGADSFNQYRLLLLPNAVNQMPSA